MSITMWTDSSITLTWLTHHPSRWKDFVHNRSSYIQDTLPQATWRFVPVENPADLATRGLAPCQLPKTSVWWTGPPWLSQPRSEWPDLTVPTTTQEFLEEKQAKVHIAIVKPKVWDLVERYSSLIKLLRITAWCQRAISRFKRIPNSFSTLTTQMLEGFWTRWSRECLQRYYARYKWNTPRPSLKVGALVLLVDERYPPAKWPLERVIQTHPGPDGLTRVVTIRTQTSELKRPIVKVCPLPVSHETL